VTTDQKVVKIHVHPLSNAEHATPLQA